MSEIITLQSTLEAHGSGLKFSKVQKVERIKKEKCYEGLFMRFRSVYRLFRIVKRKT